jgi:L-lactate dehydrogenase complex protein LldF
MPGSEFKRTVDRALDDGFLQTALVRATGVFQGNRDRTAAELGYFEEVRSRVREAKERVLSNLDQYLVQLEEQVTAAGGRVIWAEDGQEVIDYILDLAQNRGLVRVVKGKSMVSEEIHLNDALEAAGMDVLETDLGEYILQLLGEKPSHIIAPAIHRTKEQIARLFEKKLGMPYTENPEEMTQVVRRELRNRFLTADLGITGVNFAVAETGTLVILENEGNIRMSTTLPRCHVAIMGVEKVMADWDDLAAALQALPISAVGQRLSSYVSFLTGSGRQGGEGPEELHLIIMDGFRTKVLADPDFREILRCLRCGSCLNVCPIYRHLGGHSYPWVYSGPLGVVLTGAARGEESASDVAGACTLCQACQAVCPAKIDLMGLILKLRQRLALHDESARHALGAAARVMASPWGYDLFSRLLTGAATLGLDPAGGVRSVTPTLKDLGEGRRFSGPSVGPFHRRSTDKDN